ncbi:hypothetical protein XENOCAPTIV_008202 [Xenoophorus captivus]|uniref:Alkylated DNA repair protein AlkB homologue 8 N-terminal domain-containing protein n=1 Tax=Xenoophorus captivus TaxID=1517983 RepID=A0ABV0QV10_9TELE
MVSWPTGFPQSMFLGAYRTWTINTTTEFKKVQQRLFFLTMLKKTGLPQEMLITFYRWSVERIQHAASPHAHRLQRTELPKLEDIYNA